MAVKARGRRTSARRDIYQEVTDRVIAALEAGVVPWRKPWTSFGQPRSIDGRPYRGINTFLLSLSPFDDPRWGTFNAIKRHGGSVRKGERGTLVVFWKLTRYTAQGETDDDEPEQKRALLLRHFTVFNVEQCDGIEPLADVVPDFTPVEEAERIIREMPAPPKLIHRGDRAFYQPMSDTVVLPKPGVFDTPDDYYATAFHELTHSTGHESRLDRGFDGSFGSDPYAREELVAEMGSSMLCGIAGLGCRGNADASYIGSWLRVLNDDARFVVIAAAQAQKAADLILGVTFDAEDDQ